MTPIQLQTIIDGQCSHGERARILQSLDESEWRMLALALLEEQQWSIDVSALAVGFAPSPSTTKHMESLSQTVVSPLKFVEPPSRKFSSQFPGQNWFVALAAGLLVGLGFYGGGMIRNYQDTSGSLATDLGTNNTTSSGQIPKLGETGGKPNNAPIVLTSDTNSSMPRNSRSGSSEIPIYNWNEIDPDVVSTREAYDIARMNQQLRRRGYEADVQPEYYTGKLNDGRQIVVPVRNLGLRPYGL